MNFGFTDEEILFRNAVVDFCRRKISPIWVKIDEKGEIPLELIKDIAAQGLFGITLSSPYGGQAGTATMAAIAIEEVAYHDPALAIPVLLLIHNSWPRILEAYGTDEAKDEILPRVTRGECIFSIASTEVQGGSDVAGIRTLTAKRKDHKTWVLNGEKSLISFMPAVEKLPWGGWFTIARSGALEEKHRTITDFAFLARKEGKTTEGFSYSVFEEIGRHGVKTGTVSLKNIEIEDKYRIGEVNRGFKVAMEGFNLARCLVGVASVGAARWALDQGLAYIKERRAFGRVLASFQGVNFKFAELYGQLEAAKLLCYKAAKGSLRKSEGRRGGLRSSENESSANCLASL
jgi:acyl-CoA dehydrogenase